MRWIMCEEILSRSAFVVPRSNPLVQNAMLSESFGATFTKV